jgi:hypothetical protein
MLAGSASRIVNGAFVIPPVFWDASTANVVVRAIFTPRFANLRISFTSAGLKPGNPGMLTFHMKGFAI